MSHVPLMTHAKPSRPRLPRHILQLIHKKKRAWQQARSNPTDSNICRFKYTSSILLNTMKAFRLHKDYVALSNVSVRHFYREASKRLSQPKDTFPLLDSSGVLINTDKEKAKSLIIHSFKTSQVFHILVQCRLLCKALKQILPMT